MKFLGAALLGIGLLFLLSCWNSKSSVMFLLQLVSVPLLIDLGLRLLG